MEDKEKKLKKLRKEVVDQEEEKAELEISDEIYGNKIDPEAAPGVDMVEEMEDEFEAQETEREVMEDDETFEGMGIEEEEEEGEEPYPEIEEELNREDETDSEEED